MAAPTSPRSVHSRPTTTIAVIRNRVLPIRRPRAIRHRGRILRQAAAIPLHPAPTPHPAAVIAVVVALAVAVVIAAVVVGAAEVEAAAHTAVEVAEVPTVVEAAPTATTKSFC